MTFSLLLVTHLALGYRHGAGREEENFPLGFTAQNHSDGVNFSFLFAFLLWN